MILSEANPFAWDRCDHSGIGQLGCPTCDPDKSRCLSRARYLAYCEVTAEREACAQLADAESKIDNAGAAVGLGFAVAPVWRDFDKAANLRATRIAAAIRARGGQ